MKYVITQFDGVSDFEDNVAGLLVVPDDVVVDEVVAAIENEFMADMGETWDSLDDFLEDKYPTVSYEGFEAQVFI